MNATESGTAAVTAPMTPAEVIGQLPINRRYYHLCQYAAGCLLGFTVDPGVIVAEHPYVAGHRVRVTGPIVPARTWRLVADRLVAELDAKSALQLAAVIEKPGRRGYEWFPDVTESAAPLVAALADAQAAQGAAWLSPGDVTVACVCERDCAVVQHTLLDLGRAFEAGVSAWATWLGMDTEPMLDRLTTLTAPPGLGDAASFHTVRPLAGSPSLVDARIDILASLGHAPPVVGGTKFTAALGAIYDALATRLGTESVDDAETAETAPTLASADTDTDTVAVAAAAADTPANVGTPGAPAATVRAWARAQGMRVGDRGRLGHDVFRAFRAAHSEPASA